MAKSKVRTYATYKSMFAGDAPIFRSEEDAIQWSVSAGVFKTTWQASSEFASCAAKWGHPAVFPLWLSHCARIVNLSLPEAQRRVFDKPEPTPEQLEAMAKRSEEARRHRIEKSKKKKAKEGKVVKKK